MRRLVLIAIISILLFGGCVSTDTDEYQSVHYKYPLEKQSKVWIDIKAGQVIIENSNLQEITIDALVANLDSFIVSREGTNVFINNGDSNSQETIIVSVPANITIDISTFSANVHVVDVRGAIDVRTVAGNIIIESFNGEGLLWAGRGDVEVFLGQGELVVIGEHGNLSVSEFVGEVSMTSIMGSLFYRAPEVMRSLVALEVDHGAVDVSLSKDANLAVQVKTTSGYVTCIGIDFFPTVDGCEGVLGDGTGLLTVRTVSGAVNLFVSSSEQED
ncbi:MAG: hypothetical protein HOC26_12850 [Chloroflexi bacterium]|jgi:DUF4097 and DUF4098 domain-containing protein YvlB|nr:hypothetical protein [Chloroflexota bacterium]